MTVRWTGTLLDLAYRVDCPARLLALPDPAEPQRTDGLWQHTCFEAFVADGKGAYAEFNLAPSGQWAAYDFDGYRSAMRPREMRAPAIACNPDHSEVLLSTQIDLGGLSGPLGLSAVIEEKDGTKSYWAVAHPDGKPDFHHAACFAATLPAP